MQEGDDPRKKKICRAVIPTLGSYVRNTRNKVKSYIKKVRLLYGDMRSQAEGSKDRSRR